MRFSSVSLSIFCPPIVNFLQNFPTKPRRSRSYIAIYNLISYIYYYTSEKRPRRRRFRAVSTIFGEVSTIFGEVSTIFGEVSTIFGEVSTILFLSTFDENILLLSLFTI